MNISNCLILDQATPGYRRQLGISEVDVWHGFKRYIFQAGDIKDRVMWKAAVAQHILGPNGKAADLRGAHPSYRIGGLKREGSQTISARKGDPVHSQGKLEAVACLRQGSAEWQSASVPELTKHGQAFVLDVYAQTAWVYRGFGRNKNTLFKNALIRAFAFTSGPRVKVVGTFPVYTVYARRWTTEELAKRASVTMARIHREKGALASKRRQAEAKAVRDSTRARVEAARKPVKELAFKVGQLTIRLRDAETSAGRWGGRYEDKAAEYRAWLVKAWQEWHTEAKRVTASGLAGFTPLPAPNKLARYCAGGRWRGLIDASAVALAETSALWYAGKREDDDE